MHDFEETYEPGDLIEWVPSEKEHYVFRTGNDSDEVAIQHYGWTVKDIMTLGFETGVYLHPAGNEFKTFFHNRLSDYKKYHWVLVGNHKYLFNINSFRKV
jgi:hypothetical protein